jgi:hypothetical protein
MARQAVIVIHGIGEQRPMDTLRSFVMGVLGTDTKPNGEPAFYSKPDPNSDSFELRRFRAFDSTADTDFLEFYWQHRMPIAPGRFVLSWLWLLMRRPVTAVPGRFRLLWWLCWAVVAVGALVLLGRLAGELFGFDLPLPTLPKLGLGAAFAVGAIWATVRSYVGDAAIYLNPHPRTVEARNDIRTAGVALLERLHEDGRYARIVVAGHSLGSVIAYDILGFAWNRASERWRRRVQDGELPVPQPSQGLLDKAEKLAGREEPPTADEWHDCVAELLTEQRAAGLEWLVTDLVTLGSPLAHASFLLARGPEDFVRRGRERELPLVPPAREDKRHFSFFRQCKLADGSVQKARVLDHAALFAVTAWTNLYFPCRYFLYGDLVGGPVAPIFGPGVRDRPVATSVLGGWLSHTFYWTRRKDDPGGPQSSVQVLIEALDLARLGPAYASKTD